MTQLCTLFTKNRVIVNHLSVAGLQFAVLCKINEAFIKGLLQLSQKANGYNIAVYFRGEFSMNSEGVFDRLRESKGFSRI